MKRKAVAIAAVVVMIVGSAAPAFAADPSPGNSGHEGAGTFTAKFAPAATPGNS